MNHAWCSDPARDEAVRAAEGAANSPESPVSSEPVAWGVRFPEGQIVPFNDRGLAEAKTKEANNRAMAVVGVSDAVKCVPLYTAPPPARGWLTEEERSLLSSLADHWKSRAAELERPGTWGSGLPNPKSLRLEAAMLTALLARSTPPEVELPPMVIAYDDMDMLQEALAAAGVKVKEVGRE